jgi:hypothetical protein
VALAELNNALGDTMGLPIECAHIPPDGENRQQLTTTGLAFIRAADGTTIFTDGARSWALLSGSLVTWSTDEDDPPLPTIVEPTNP